MRYIFFCLAAVAFLSCNNAGNSSDATNAVTDVSGSNANGQDLFTTHCSTCHKPNADFLGPGLKGAKSRWVDKKLLYEFVRNPESVIEKDGYAASLQERYQGNMTPFPNLSNEEIDAILAYCNQ
jgi:mono/diheme cytochrome c family protein